MNYALKAIIINKWNRSYTLQGYHMRTIYSIIYLVWSPLTTPSTLILLDIPLKYTVDSVNLVTFTDNTAWLSVSFKHITLIIIPSLILSSRVDDLVVKDPLVVATVL